MNFESLGDPCCIGGAVNSLAEDRRTKVFQKNRIYVLMPHQARWFCPSVFVEAWLLGGMFTERNYAHKPFKILKKSLQIGEKTSINEVFRRKDSSI